MARSTTSVGNVETLVESRQSVREDDDELDDIVEAVEAGLLMEPPRLSWRHTIVNYACSKGRTESEQARCEDEEEELVTHASGAEFLDALAARDDEAEADDGHRQEGQEGEIGQGNGLDDVSLIDDGLLERVEADDETDDEHDQARNHGRDERAQDDPAGHAPAETRVVRPQHALDEDEVGDEDDDDASVSEDLGGDGDADVCRVAGPDDAHDVCGDAGHGEAEEEAGEDEFVAAAPVALEDCHVEGGGGDEEGEDDGGDGDVDGGGWGEAEDGVFGGVRGALMEVGMLVIDDDSCEDDMRMILWCFR